jgi:hypothetical protein
MTFAALSTIHALLEQEKYKAEKVLECARYSYYEEYDQKEEELGSRAKADKAMIGRAVTANYDSARSDLNRITEALREFNEQDWR